VSASCAYPGCGYERPQSAQESREPAEGYTGVIPAGKSASGDPGPVSGDVEAERFVTVADHVHAVIARHFGYCPDRDGDPLCYEIADAVTEAAW